MIAFVKAKHQQTCGMKVAAAYVPGDPVTHYTCTLQKDHTGPCQDVHEGVQWSMSR